MSHNEKMLAIALAPHTEAPQAEIKIYDCDSANNE